MNLREAIAKIDKTSSRAQDWSNIEDFSQELGLNVYTGHHEFEQRVKKYWIHSWYCTDTWVGLAAYFMDDELICVTVQKGRKWDEEFQWVSKEAALKVRDFILDIDKDDSREVSLLNLDEDLSGLAEDGERVTYSVFKENNG